MTEKSSFLTGNDTRQLLEVIMRFAIVNDGVNREHEFW